MSTLAPRLRRRVGWLVAALLGIGLALLWWQGGEAVFVAALIAPLC